MTSLIERNEEHNYCLYQSEYIMENMDGIIHDCYAAHNRFKSLFPGKDSTWAYNRYNIFSLTATSIRFYKIYEELVSCMKAYLKFQGIENQPFWMQAWMNFHKPDQVLDWHDHDWPFHGYMSIDPKKSETVFKQFSVQNQAGVLYFGEGHNPHAVKVLEPYEGERITIAYDITLTPNKFSNISLIPVL